MLNVWSCFWLKDNIFLNVGFAKGGMVANALFFHTFSDITFCVELTWCCEIQFNLFGRIGLENQLESRFNRNPKFGCGIRLKLIRNWAQGTLKHLMVNSESWRSMS